MSSLHAIMLLNRSKNHNNKVDIKEDLNCSLKEDLIILTILLSVAFFCFNSVMFGLRTENYKLIKTEQIYDIKGKTTYYDNRFIIDRIKKCSKDKHGKTCQSYYIFYVKQEDNQKGYIELELPTNKTQIINNNRTVASINTYKDCQFFRCDYKYKITLPIKKKPFSLQVTANL